MNKTLSVIIPVHNKASTLQFLIDSIKFQRAPLDQFELIFVVDQCSDESSLIIENFRRNGKGQVVIVRCDEGSAARARNLGVKAAMGKYCLFLDSDIVTPPNLFVEVIAHLQSLPDTILLIPVYGNSGSLSVWPFLVQDHEAYRSLGSLELLPWARTQSALIDLRTLYANTDGSLAHLPAPWVFCWSSAMAVSKDRLTITGGFGDSFSYKGSEDLELGYRLHRAGARFKLMIDAPVLHLPHPRNRDREERIDRLQEREMLKLYPTREMETLCAFDGSHANPMLSLLEQIDAQIIRDLTASLNKTIAAEKLRLPHTVKIIIGLTPAWLLELVTPDYAICPHLQPSERHLPLFGFALPFEDKTFEGAVLVGIWQLLPERLSCRLIDEALRVAKEVYLIKDKEMRTPLTLSTEQLAVHDAPYWERTHPIRRSFYDFALTHCGQDGPLYSFLVQYSAGDAL